jgi:hypothetical protein
MARYKVSSAAVNGKFDVHSVSDDSRWLRSLGLVDYNAPNPSLLMATLSFYSESIVVPVCIACQDLMALVDTRATSEAVIDEQPVRNIRMPSRAFEERLRV